MNDIILNSLKKVVSGLSVKNEKLYFHNCVVDGSIKLSYVKNDVEAMGSDSPCGWCERPSIGLFAKNDTSYRDCNSCTDKDRELPLTHSLPEIIFGSIEISNEPEIKITLW